MNADALEKVSRMRELVEGSSYIVFLGGAGVSTESGIPDFRSENGLYSGNYDVPPEVMLSHDFFIANPEKFYRFFRSALVAPDTVPNTAHTKLAELEGRGLLKAVITQNIDGLHQKAGSVNVLELHGSSYRFYCMSCGRSYGAGRLEDFPDVPRCACGGIVRPDVTLYGESLNQNVLSSAVNYIRRADMLIVGGTSLRVYPAAGLVDYYMGNRLVLINNSPTSYDGSANLLIEGKIGEVFSYL